MEIKTEVTNVNELTPAKVEKISLAELKAENQKIKNEENKKILEEFNKDLTNFMDGYLALTEEQKQQLWDMRNK